MRRRLARARPRRRHGGAHFGDASGLVGLRDRAEALGGHLQLEGPPGAGTTLDIELSLEPGGPKLPHVPGW
jgi:nitrate/nitrite-specific signal transduction histidine kinase